MDKLIEFIEEQRGKLGLSWEQLAEKADVPYWAILKMKEDEFLPEVLKNKYSKIILETINQISIDLFIKEKFKIDLKDKDDQDNKDKDDQGKKYQYKNMRVKHPIEKKRDLLRWSRKILSEKAGVPEFAIVAIEKRGKVPNECYFRVIETLDNALSELSNPPINKSIEEKIENLGHIFPKKIEKKHRWSSKFDRCIKCGTQETKHAARGLCVGCYEYVHRIEHEGHEREKRVASKIITKEFLIEQYFDNKKSLNEIAKECKCSRQFIYKKMKEYQIKLRDPSTARVVAINKEKIKYERIDNDGKVFIVKHVEHSFKEDFFSHWTATMAWVLGVVCSDGNILFDHDRNLGQMTISQKEPEILNKVKDCMECNVNLLFTKQITPRGNQTHIYRLQLANSRIYFDLIRLGIKPNKSLDIKFPKIPSKYIRHFIRGCWDGDGSIFFDGMKKNLIASYISGSLDFIRGMLNEFEEAGFPKRKIYVTKNTKNPYYSFKFFGSQVEKLYHYFYDNVPPEQYLSRKHDVFWNYFYGNRGVEK